MRILVTADVHLTDEHQERRDALEEVVGLANRKDADYLLIAGDMFDRGVDVETVKTDIRDLFSDNGFQSYVIPGNHDEAAFRDEDYFGDDIEVLSSQPFEQVDLNGVNLLAVPFIEGEFRDLIEELSRARKEDRLNILMLHGTLSSTTGHVFGEESRYLPFTPEDLLETGIEYVFAGHFHSLPTKRTFGDGDCVFAYPGSPVSITKRETKRRGVWLFDTDEEELRGLKVDSFHYLREKLDLSPGEAEDKLVELEERLSDRDLENVSLLVEPSGFIEMSETDFFDKLEEILQDAGAKEHEVDRSQVESARVILDSDLYRSFEEKLEEKKGIDQRRVQRMALRALSMEERG